MLALAFGNPAEIGLRIGAFSCFSGGVALPPQLGVAAHCSTEKRREVTFLKKVFPGYARSFDHPLAGPSPFSQ